MGTSRTTLPPSVSIEVADGVTNTHIRQQIQKLRRSKGWTEQDLEQAAGIAVNSLGGLEAGIRRINVDTLRKIVEALDADIVDVWPSSKPDSGSHRPLPLRQAANPDDFFRLSEVHSLTNAEASCMFMRERHADPTQAAAEPKPPLQALCSINLDEREKERMSQKLQQGTINAPWVAFVHCENGRSLYLCLKNADTPIWVESLIQGCLSAWLAANPL